MWGSTCVCVCVCVVAASGCVLVSLSGTHLHEPHSYNSLKQPEQSSRWQIHTHTTHKNQILGWEYLTYNSLLPYTWWYLSSLPTTTNNNYFLNVLCGWAHEEELNIVWRKSSKYSWCKSLLTYTKDQKFGSPQLCQSCWVCTPPILSRLQTKQGVRHTLSRLAILH